MGGDITNVSNTENLIYIGKQSGFIKGMTEKIEVGYIQENKIETKTVIREDYKEEEKKNVNIITNYNDYKMNFENVKKALDGKGLNSENAEITMYPQNEIEITDIETATKILKLYDDLEDNEDVQEIYANFNISDEILEKMEG